MKPQKNISKQIKSRNALFLLALTTTGVGVGVITAAMPIPAHAQEMVTQRSKIVQHGDLNLASDTGIDTLRHRIRRAAKSVCGSVGITSIINVRRVRECVDGARSNAWAVAERKIERRRFASGGSK